MTRLLAILGMLGLALAMPPGASAAERSGMKHILILGDSLSDGFNLNRSQAYPALLGQKLNAAGLDQFEITNVSQSGGTTEDGAVNLRNSGLKKPIDIFVLELGINDVFQGSTVEEIQANLQGIIDKVKAANPNARIIVVGMEFPQLSGNDFVDAFQKMFADLAEKNHAALVPNLFKGVQGNRDLMLADGIHPNREGQKVFAKNVWEISSR